MTTSTSTLFQQEVTDKLAESAPAVREAVKTKLVDREQQARADAVLAVIEKLSVATKALASIKEDQQLYGSDGKVIQAGFSKAKLDERNKAQAEIDKREKALTAAINPEDGKYDFSKVKALAGKPSKPEAAAE